MQAKYPTRIFVTLFTALVAAGAFAETSLRDPTSPFNVKQVAKGKPAAHVKLKLDSILVSTNRRHAVVNGRRLTLGDRIQGMRVAQIEADSVLLTGHDRDVRIQLADSSVKKISKPSGLAMRTNQ